MNADLPGSLAGSGLSHPSADNAGCLQELERLLRRQVELARQGSLEELSASSGRLEELLARLPAGAVAASASSCRTVRRLYEELCLILATRKAEVGRRLKEMGAGKACLRAYRGNSPDR